MTKPKRRSISHQLRGFIRGAKVSQASIAREIGIPRSTLSSYMAGKCGLSGRTIDLLCAHLHLKLVQVPKRQRKALRDAQGRLFDPPAGLALEH